MTVRTLLGVFAHPDDECTCAGGVFSRHADTGLRVILVSCTNGEFGDDLDGAKPGEHTHDPVRVATTRRAELDAACQRLGVSSIERLGYHDSGMPGWAMFAEGTVFSAVPVEVVSARLGRLLDRYRPDIVVTHNADASHEHVDHRHAARGTATGRAGLQVGYDAVLQRARCGAVAAADCGVGADRRVPPRAGRAPAARVGRDRVADHDSGRPGPVVLRKRAALLEHGSQLGSSLAGRLSAEQYESVFATESFIHVCGDNRLENGLPS